MHLSLIKGIFVEEERECYVVNSFRNYLNNIKLQKNFIISAGIGPQLAHLYEIGRVDFSSATDKEALEAFSFFSKNEGIIPALESSHALAGVLALCKKVKGKKIIVNISGRGDKDIFITTKALASQKWKNFLQDEISRIG